MSLIVPAYGIILAMKTAPLLFALLFLLLSGCASQPSSPTELTPASPSNSAYIENKGSDTMVNLALAWAEAYQKQNPQVRISVTGGGSGTGIAALINGTVDLANASRQIKPEELENAKANGHDATEFVVAKDAIAVIVNPGNPVQHLSLQQISDIYSGKINNWKDVGGEDRTIVRLSRETNSGTHVYFLEEVLRLGKKDDTTLFARNTLLLPSSEGITSETRDNPNAIGYDGLGYVTPDVKVLAVAKGDAADPNLRYVLPSAETVNDSTYPIARDLYMYTNGQPTPVIQTYLDWIFGPDGQAIVKELGFVPIQKAQAALP